MQIFLIAIRPAGLLYGGIFSRRTPALRKIMDGRLKK